MSTFRTDLELACHCLRDSYLDEDEGQLRSALGNIHLALAHIKNAEAKMIERLAKQLKDSTKGPCFARKSFSALASRTANTKPKHLHGAG